MFEKIYVHHYYTKSLFYKLAHNTTNRIYNIQNEKGSVKCLFNDIELIFGHYLTNMALCFLVMFRRTIFIFILKI